MFTQQRPNSAQPKAQGTYTKYFQPEFAAKQNKCKLGTCDSYNRCHSSHSGGGEKKQGSSR